MKSEISSLIHVLERMKAEISSLIHMLERMKAAISSLIHMLERMKEEISSLIHMLERMKAVILGEQTIRTIRTLTALLVLLEHRIGQPVSSGTYWLKLVDQSSSTRAQNWTTSFIGNILAEIG